MAVEEATVRQDSSLLMALHEILTRKASALTKRDVAEIFELSGHFHDRIIDSSQNAFLRQTMAPLGRLIQFYRFALLRRSLNFDGVMDAYVQHFQHSHRRHQGMLMAMESGDAKGAARLMEENLRASAQDMDQIFNQSQVGRVTTNDDLGAFRFGGLMLALTDAVEKTPRSAGNARHCTPASMAGAPDSEFRT